MACLSSILMATISPVSVFSARFTLRARWAHPGPGGSSYRARSAWAQDGARMRSPRDAVGGEAAKQRGTGAPRTFRRSQSREWRRAHTFRPCVAFCRGSGSAGGLGPDSKRRGEAQGWRPLPPRTGRSPGFAVPRAQRGTTRTVAPRILGRRRSARGVGVAVFAQRLFPPSPALWGRRPVLRAPGRGVGVDG